MKRLTRVAGTLALTTTLLGVFAGPAAAVVPRGRGLLPPEALFCPELGGSLLKIEPRGLAPSQWTTGGQHLVIERITFTSIDGIFTETFGTKAGLATTTCSATHTLGDGTVITVIVVYGILPS